jgi:hypothetical protein
MPDVNLRRHQLPSPCLHAPANAPGGFALVDALMGLAVCLISLAAFYTASAQAVKMVRTARERAVASQLIEQRLEDLRTRPSWRDVIAAEGLKAVLKETPSAANLLTDLTEQYVVLANPGTAPAYTVFRAANGRVAVGGNPLPISQTSVRIVTTITWGAADRQRQSRSLATILTKGGL